jgi:hypothetical protein
MTAVRGRQLPRTAADMARYFSKRGSADTPASSIRTKRSAPTFGDRRAIGDMLHTVAFVGLPVDGAHHASTLLPRR